MEKKRSLSVDVPGSIAAFEAAAHYFEIKTKIYRLMFQGKGLDFEQFRSYSQDDDSSTIDWMASVRAQKTLVRQYKEERDLKIVFVIDVSDSMVSGSTPKLKCEYAAEVALALAHLILTSGDKVGFILFNSDIVHYALPMGGMKQFYYLDSFLENPLVYGGAAHMEKAIEFATTYFAQKISSFIIVSDFLHVGRDFERVIHSLAARAESIALMIKDPLDMTLPDASEEIVIQDPMTHEQLLVNPKVARQQYEQFAIQQEEKVMSALNHSNVDTIRLLTTTPFAFPLAQFLKERIMRK